MKVEEFPENDSGVSEWRLSLTESECAALARGCRLTKWLGDGTKLTLQSVAVPGAQEESE